ncbi:MAG: lipopolysaccharide biosynthesis protein [Alphaproteobacteria bacterium]
MTDFNFDPPHQDIKSHAASGFAFTGTTQVIRILTQFFSVIILARLLEPADFGIMAMAVPIYSFAQMFNNLGINQSTIQTPKVTSKQLNSFFWVNVTFGVLVCLVLAIASPAVGWFYKDSRTTHLTIALAVLVALGGFGSLHGAIMVRKMQFRSNAILNITSMIVALIVSIIWAYIWGGYWALYAGLAVGSLISTVGVWYYVRWRPGKPAWAPETPEMMRSGLHVSAAHFLSFLAGSLNNIVIGRVLGEHPLGLYDRASKLVAAPLQQMINPISSTVGPILYRLHDNNERFRSTFLRTVNSITLAIMPGVVWVIALPDILIETLMGSKWSEATPIFVALSFAALPQLINSSVWWLFTAQGRTLDYLRWGIFDSVVTILALIVGLPFGVVGVAQAWAISQLLRSPLYWWYGCREGAVKLKDVVKTVTPQIVGGIIAYILIKELRYASSLGPWSLLIGGCILSYTISIVTVACFPDGRGAIAKDYDFIKYMMQKIFKRALPKR